jgi:hypothetical protein
MSKTLTFSPQKIARRMYLGDASLIDLDKLREMDCILCTVSVYAYFVIRVLTRLTSLWRFGNETPIL